MVVKFDLGSLGFEDGEQINSKLMQGVRRGVFGEFTVAPESYDFMPLDCKLVYLVLNIYLFKQCNGLTNEMRTAVKKKTSHETGVYN